MSLELRVKGAANPVKMKHKWKEQGCDLAGNSSQAGSKFLFGWPKGHRDRLGAGVPLPTLGCCRAGPGVAPPDTTGGLKPPAVDGVNRYWGSSLPDPQALSSSALCSKLSFCLSRTVARAWAGDCPYLPQPIRSGAILLQARVLTFRGGCWRSGRGAQVAQHPQERQAKQILGKLRLISH